MSWLPAVLKVRFVRWALAALTICMLCPAETTLRQRHPVRSIKTGYGLSADAHHITTPSAEGPMRCMKNAMRQAGLNPSDIQYLNAHGTSTSVGDVNETNAIKLAFGEDAKKLVVYDRTPLGRRRRHRIRLYGFGTEESSFSSHDQHFQSGSGMRSGLLRKCCS